MEESFWNAFCETGEPTGYLLYRTVSAVREAEKEKANESDAFMTDGGASATA